jgi:transcriptional regulator with GAF, ATPase, and Fis domain
LRHKRRYPFSFPLESVYNFNVVFSIIRGGSRIPVDSVFSAISEINEAISLTNDETKLVNAVLDTLTQELGVECCWVQTINPDVRRLHLAAQRGFTGEMKMEMTDMETNIGFGEQVVGLGQKIVIPDASANGHFQLTSFWDAGYRWMVAVPMMTYRNHGVVGIASRDKRKYKRETAGLMTVIAGLVGMALLKTRLFRTISALEKKGGPAPREAVEPEAPVASVQRVRAEPEPPRPERPARQPVPLLPQYIPQTPVKENRPEADVHKAFQAHSVRMASFRRAHGRAS